MNIHPIRSETDYEAACNRIDEIFNAEPGTPESDELDVLVILVDEYEERHFPIDMPHPIEAIKIQMENLGISRKSLMGFLGKGSGRISEILNCKRPLTLKDIRRLNELLKIPIDILSQEYEVEKSVSGRAAGSDRPAACR